MPSRTDRRIAVIGAGITGAAAAWEAIAHSEQVTLFEADERVGGKTLATPFAGLDAVDCGADAFLARVPDATALAQEVGLGDELVHPNRVGAAVWYDRLHDIPDGLVLGVPGNPFSLARSGLLSRRGKARAALEPFIRRSSTAHDSIGMFIRGRFGDEVHERLVDALVGSIYATDTDRASLSELPQLANLSSHRSLLLAARKVARAHAGTSSAEAAPIFATPRSGAAGLTKATVDAFVDAGGTLVSGTSADVRPDGARWLVGDERFDAVVLAIPAASVVDALATAVDTDRTSRFGSASEVLSRAETADVVMVTLHIAADEWPDRLSGRSGYLVPKPVQHDVTAVSFGSQKWSHWAPPAGGQILRVSLGRDGAPVLHLDDDAIIERTIADLHRHLGVTFTPAEVRINRWPAAFAQYRPHHRDWVDEARSRLPHGLFIAGAGFDGNGIPACIRSGRTNGERAVVHARVLAS